MNTLEKTLKLGHGIDTNAPGRLTKPEFLQTLEYAVESGVVNVGSPDWELVRNSFSFKSTGKQSHEIVRAWDQGYKYQLNN